MLLASYLVVIMRVCDVRDRSASAEGWQASVLTGCSGWCRLFEPWTITSRQHSVPSDERFRGYGKNKVQQVHAQMHVHDSR